MKGLFLHRSPALLNRLCAVSARRHVETAASTPEPIEDDSFRTLQIRPPPRRSRTFHRRQTYDNHVMPPRYTRQPLDQDWPSVWPAAASFRQSAVPLALRFGRQDIRRKYSYKRLMPPGKYGNAELMKIPNFLHLTPPAIERHCAALKQFCTEWPSGLADDAVVDELYPINYLTSDYCFASSSIRSPKARVVSLRVKLSSLSLNYHAKDKLLRLAGNRYNPEDDTLTILTTRCPHREQNRDYAKYLLTALYFEAWTTESWESNKSFTDLERYTWEQSASKEAVVDIIARQAQATGENKPDVARKIDDGASTDEIASMEEVQQYATAVEHLHNQGESEQTLQDYKKAVLKILT